MRKSSLCCLEVLWSVKLFTRHAKALGKDRVTLLNMWNQNAELEAVMQSERIVSITFELDVSLCSHCTKEPNSAVLYMLNAVVRP